MNALLCSGFYAWEGDFDERFSFYENIWLPNIGDRDAVIVDNSCHPTRRLESKGRVRVIRVEKNAGHVHAFLGKHRPHILGWSLSWIIPSLIAYSEGLDMVYFEQDALAFHNWEQIIYNDMEEKNLVMAFGEGCDVAAVEQSIFVIKHAFISEVIAAYLAIPEGDGAYLPEAKFKLMSEHDFRIGKFSLPGGRIRPLPYDAPAWYGQKFSGEELEELKRRSMI